MDQKPQLLGPDVSRVKIDDSTLKFDIAAMKSRAEQQGIRGTIQTMYAHTLNEQEAWKLIRSWFDISYSEFHQLWLKLGPVA